MAHFAEIDNYGIVLRVLVVDDSQEHRGQEFLAEDLGLGGTWIQTSYNSKIRGKYAAIGDKYDKKKDEFISPKIIENDSLEIKEAQRQAILDRLGLTADEAKLLLG
jgi:hypothetical protein